MYLRPAPNCGARLCTNLSPFPEQRATSQPDSTFLSLPYSLALIPQQLVYFWPHKHCTICLRLFLLQLHLSGAASALGKLSCEETTTPWGFKPCEIRMQSLPAPTGTFTYLLRFSCSSWFQKWCIPSARVLAHILLDAAMCHKVICKIIITWWDEERKLALN